MILETGVTFNCLPSILMTAHSSVRQTLFPISESYDLQAGPDPEGGSGG